MDDKGKDDGHSSERSETEKVVSALKYPVAAGVGYFYGHRYARNALYDTLKNRGVFKEGEKKLDKAVQGVVKVAQKTAGSLKGKIRPLSIKYNDGVTTFLEEKGFHNTIDYIKELHPNQQFDTAVAFFSAASIALGVIMTIGENKSLMDRFNKSRDKHAEAAR